MNLFQYQSRFHRVCSIAILHAVLICLTACKDEVPIGPIASYEGTYVGVHLSKVLDKLPAKDDTYLYNGKYLVGRIENFVPADIRGIERLTRMWQSLYDSDVLYDLETKMVFQFRARVRAPFYEADCRIFGENFFDRIKGKFQNVDVELRSIEHGSVSVLPAQREKSMQQNFLIGECPIGYRFTPNEPTTYEISLTNGYLHRQIIGW